MKAHLRDHEFPGAVATDEKQDPGPLGATYDAYRIAYFGLPRLVLLDIDHKVIWEGDPGFKRGEKWDPALESFLQPALDDLIERRKLGDLAKWRKAWKNQGRPALATGRLDVAAPYLLAARELDGERDPVVGEAHAALGALRNALETIEKTADELAARGAAETLESLIRWADAIEEPVDGPTLKTLSGHLKGDGAKNWRRALGMLSPLRKALEAEKNLPSVDRVLERLATIDGELPSILHARLAATNGDRAAVAKLVEIAPSIPARWLAKEYFGW